MDRRKSASLFSTLDEQLTSQITFMPGMFSDQNSSGATTHSLYFAKLL
jgi:hypothetical protein